MKRAICISDITTGTGNFISGSVKVTFAGVGVAYKGYSVLCPLSGHGRTVIAERLPVFKHNEIPLAFDDHLCARGCVLISSLPEVEAS